MAELFPWWPYLTIPIHVLYLDYDFVVDFSYCESILQMLVPYFVVLAVVIAIFFVVRVVLYFVRGGD